MLIITCTFPFSNPLALTTVRITAVFFSAEGEKNLAVWLCTYNVVQAASTGV